MKHTNAGNGNESALRRIERRLDGLERAVSELARRVQAADSDAVDPKWYITQAGRFADDPVFDEIVRLGREYRESLRPGKDRKNGRQAEAPGRRGGKARRAHS